MSAPAAGDAADLALFHDELRAQTRAILGWSAVVFNFLYLAWTFFDRALEPGLASRFLAIRVAVVTVNVLLGYLLTRTRLSRRVFEGVWCWLMFYVLGDLPMLVSTRDHLTE